MTKRFALFAVAGLLLAAAGPAPRAGAEETQKHFASAKEAAAALVAAVRAGDQPALLAILGAEAEPIVDSGDAVADRNAGERFVAAYDEAHKLLKEPEGRTELLVGEDDWPLPIPLVETEAGWRFDTEQGKEEILARRIGRNELFTIESVRAYVDAQREYFLRNPEKRALPGYARKFTSSPGKRDGLYWETAEGEEPSPLGPLFAEANAEGYRLGSGEAGQPVPYHGYIYRILESQGPHAKGGAYDYVVRDTMLGGFALIASPVEYDESGVMTFLVNYEGVVYQKDLGPDTESLAKAITQFDPDDSWTRVEDED
jgi:hypothetical protein